MKSSSGSSPGLHHALRLLRSSYAFRLATRESRSLLIWSAVALVVAVAAGLYAVESQALLLLSFNSQATDEMNRWLRVLLIFFVAQLIFELLSWMRRSLQNRISVRISNTLRKHIYDKFSSLRFAELQNVSAGELAQIFTSDASLIAGVWTDGLLAFCTTLFLTLGVSVFLTVQVGASGSVFFVVLFLLVFLARKFARQTAPVLRKRAEYSASRLALIQESIRSVMLVKALTVEEEFSKRVKKQADLEQDMKLRATEISCRYIPVFASLRWLGWAGLLLWVVYAPLIHGEEIPGEVLVGLVFSVNWYSSLLQDSFLFVGNYLSSIQVGAVSAQRLDRFLQLESKQIDVFPADISSAPLSLENASVAYPNRPERWALRDVSVAIPRGQLTVVTGPVGCGKSTLLRTLLGELSLAEGKLSRAPGMRMAFLSQDVALPSANLRDVLRFQYQNTLDEDPLLLRLLAGAEFTTDLQTLPEGLATPVGERGVTLSGGQRMRVGLAQLSYFKDADVILLDDPLAALDEATAHTIIQHLFLGAWRGKTLVITAHRPELLACADWLLEMRDGRVVRMGPPGK